MNYYNLIRAGLFISQAIISSVIYADSLVTSVPFEDLVKPGTVGLGGGFRTGSSPYPGVETISSIWNDNNSDLLPLYLYEGKYLFARGSRAGIHVFDNDALEFNLLASYRFDRLEPGASEFLTGMSDREQTVDGGLQLAYKGDWGKLSAHWLNDMLSVHNGQEFALSYQYKLDWNNWSFSPYVTYTYQDDALADYYYGVRPDEATPDRPAYSVSGGDFLRFGLNTSYRIGDRFLLYGNVAIEGLNDSAYDSPLTAEEAVSSAMVGMVYLFGNARDGSDIRPASLRGNEWSWRVNFGYNAEYTFNSIFRGKIQKDKDVPTNLAGLTFGKLLHDGDKVEYWGKFSFNRRLEKDYQDDFWEYVAYVMAMGKGYSPWTNRELFRWGFGFGFSYAERVPIIEQIDQANRGRNTSHFLNYLEIQLDFPLRNFTKSRSLSGCYVGTAIVHRSGIFGSSDLLGNVDGGSNIISLSLECIRK